MTLIAVELLEHQSEALFVAVLSRPFFCPSEVDGAFNVSKLGISASVSPEEYIGLIKI